MFGSVFPLRGLIAGCLLAMTAAACAQDFKPIYSDRTAPQFIVPPGEDPSAFEPARWGLTQKGTRPASIPSLQESATDFLSPRPDYKHQTAIGNYQPSQTSAQESSIAPANPPYPGYQPATGYPYPIAVPAEPTAVNYAESQEQTRLPFLRMTAEEAAYQPSPFHVKEESPSLKEVLKTGAWFTSYKAMFVEPHFQGNTAITFESPTRGFSRDYDFGYQYASAVNFGFESKKGPGFILNYWELDADSDRQVGAFDGTLSATTSIWLVGPQRLTTLTADDPGERVTAEHDVWIKSTSAMFFKEIKMPISRLNGLMGLRYLNVHHTMHSELLDAGNNQIGTLHGTHYFRGLGPSIGAEYFRPIGHTHFEFIGGSSSTLLFGHRDQVAYNTTMSDFTRFGADELLTILEAKLGAQWVREWGTRYRVFVRGTLDSQVWFGGGTASQPSNDFGLYGFSFAAGLNH
jgi:hypothetical protein